VAVAKVLLPHGGDLRGIGHNQTMTNTQKGFDRARARRGGGGEARGEGGACVSRQR
jgi:hypothetical protein